MDYIASIHKFIDPIVLNKDHIVINELPNESKLPRILPSVELQGILLVPTVI